MWNAIVVSVLMSTNAGCPGVVAAVPAGLPGYMECLGYSKWATGGVIAPHLLSLPGGPLVSAEELQMWNEYLDELSYDDRNEMKHIWEHADFEGRRKLLSQLAELRAEEKRKEEAEKKEREKREKERKEAEKKAAEKKEADKKEADKRPPMKPLDKKEP